MSLIKLALEKQAGLWDSAAKFGAGLMKNNVIKNTAIGAGTGAAAGFVTAQPGEGLSGALKGAGVGGALGGGATFAKNTFRSAGKLHALNTSSNLAEGLAAPSYLKSLKTATGNQAGQLKNTVTGAWQAR